MKRKLEALLFIVVMVSVLLAGCGTSTGISKSDYDKVVAERDSAQKELEELKGSSVSQEEYDSIVTERDELKKELEEMEQDEEDTSEPEEQTSESTEYGVGDTISAGGLEITIDDIDLEHWTYDNYYDGQVYGQGMKYVGASFSVKNVGDDEKSIMAYDFDCYADDALCDRASFYSGKYGSISSGRNTSFSLYWKVPENAGSVEIEYSYRDDSYSKKTVKIRLG